MSMTTPLTPEDVLANPLLSKEKVMEAVKHHVQNEEPHKAMICMAHHNASIKDLKTLAKESKSDADSYNGVLDVVDDSRMNSLDHHVTDNTYYHQHVYTVYKELVLTLQKFYARDFNSCCCAPFWNRLKRGPDSKIQPKTYQSTKDSITTLLSEAANKLELLLSNDTIAFKDQEPEFLNIANDVSILFSDLNSHDQKIIDAFKDSMNEHIYSKMEPATDFDSEMRKHRTNITGPAAFVVDSSKGQVTPQLS